MKNLAVRAASGLVFVTLMVVGILFNQWTYLLIMGGVLLGSLHEFYSVTKPHREAPLFRPAQKWSLIALLMGVFLVSYLLVSPPVRYLPDTGNLAKAFFQILWMQRDGALTMNVLVPGLIFILFAIELFTKHEKPFVNIGWNLVAVTYLLVPLVLTNKIFFEKGGVFLITIFAIIWLYDSACYVVGSAIGKTPLLPRVSPKKTIEGLVGGAIITLVAVYFITPFIPNIEDAVRGFMDDSAVQHVAATPVLSAIEWTILALVIIKFATLGDLVESLLKRSMNVKDSGSIMPGHGGFLDRFDAYFLTVPFIALMLWIFGQVSNLMSLLQFMKG